MNTLPILFASWTAWATPGADDVHSPTRPVRSGWAFIRSVAIWVALAWSSPAYTVSTICACGYFEAVYSFWTLIQEFRFSAVCPQDTIAYLPCPPIGLEQRVGQRLADALRRRLVDERLAHGVGRVGVGGRHVDALRLGLGQQRRHRVGVVRRHDQRVDLLLDEASARCRPAPPRRPWSGPGRATGRCPARPPPSSRPRSSPRSRARPAAWARRRPSRCRRHPRRRRFRSRPRSGSSAYTQ